MMLLLVGDNRAERAGRGRIRAAWLTDGAGRRTRVEADWFVSAMPVERARRTLSRDVYRLDPSLRRLDDLFTDWMVGIQYFLKEPVDIVHGHITFLDAPWALTRLNRS